MSAGMFGLCCCLPEMDMCAGSVARAYRRFSGVGPVRAVFHGSFTGAAASALKFQTNAQAWNISILGRPFGTSTSRTCEAYASTHYCKAVRHEEWAYEGGPWIEEEEWQWDPRTAQLVYHKAWNSGGTYREFSRDLDTGAETLQTWEPVNPPFEEAIIPEGTVSVTADGSATEIDYEESTTNGWFYRVRLTLSVPYTLQEALTAALGMLDAIVWGDEYEVPDGSGGTMTVTAGTGLSGSFMSVTNQAYPAGNHFAGQITWSNPMAWMVDWPSYVDGPWHFGVETGAPYGDEFNAYVGVGKCRIQANVAPDLELREMTLMDPGAGTPSTYVEPPSYVLDFAAPGWLEWGPEELVFDWGKGYIANCE